MRKLWRRISKERSFPGMPTEKFIVRGGGRGRELHRDDAMITSIAAAFSFVL